MIRAALLLATADAVTTAAGVRGGAEEANPVASWLASAAGLWAMLAAGIAATLVLAVVASHTSRWWIVAVCCLGLGLKSAAVVHNLTVVT